MSVGKLFSENNKRRFKFMVRSVKDCVRDCNIIRLVYLLHPKIRLWNLIATY